MAVAAVRWGIVATGNISTAFTRDLAELPDAEVVAVASRTAESANRFGDEFGIPRRHGSYDDLVADDDIDIVYVGTPHPQHYAVARACLAAGKAVLCEKPVTLNARQARDLIDTATANGVLFAEAMWMRANPVIRALFDDLAKGTIGEPLQVIADFGFQSDDLPPRLLQPELGGGALLDLGVYPATFAYAALGRPDEVRAVADVSDLGVDQNTAMVWRYASGAVAALTCGMRAQSPGTAVISGTEGALKLARFFFNPDHYIRITSAGEERVDVPRTGIGYHYEAAEVMRCLREGLTQSPLLPHADTVGVLEQLDEARTQIGVRYPGDSEDHTGDVGTGSS
jgi:predicted dehydrogenase